MGKSNFGQEELNKGKDGFPVGVVVYLLDKDNRVLLAKRSPHKRHAANKWEVISGGVKRSEQPDEAVRREVREELGEVDMSKLRYIGNTSKIKSGDFVKGGTDGIHPQI